MEDGHSSTTVHAEPQQDALAQQQQLRPGVRSASSRRLSSHSSTGSFTAISMEDEGLLGDKQEAEAAAVMSQTPPQHPHQLRLSALHDSPLYAIDDEQQGRSRTQAAWAKGSSFSNPAFMADFTALPPPASSSADPEGSLPMRVYTAPPPPPAPPSSELPSKAAKTRSPSSDAVAQRGGKEPAPPGYFAMPMAAAVGSMLAQGEELPVDRCIVSGGGFYAGGLSGSSSSAGSGSGGVLQQHGARVTQRASDGAVVLELPGARQLLLVHDEQEGGRLAMPRSLGQGSQEEASPARPGGVAGRVRGRQSTVVMGGQAAGAPHPIIRVLRTEMGGFGVGAAKATLLLGIGAGYFSTFARVLSSVEKGTSIHPGALMARCMMDSGTVVASILTGVVAGPIIASASLARLALRPALLAGAVHASVRWVRRHRNGAAALLKMLSSGDLLRQIEALKGIAKRAAHSPAFRREFSLLSGVELVLAVLADALAAAQAAIQAAAQEQAADAAENAADAAGGPVIGGGRARAKQPRDVRARGAVAAAKASSTAAAAAAAVRGRSSGGGGGGGAWGPEGMGACIVGPDGNAVPVVGLSGPLPMLATQALRELMRSPEHTVAPLVRAGGVTLMVHAAAISTYAASAAAPAKEGGASGRLQGATHTPLAVAALQVLESVTAAPLCDVALPTATDAAAPALTRGDSEDATAKEGFAHAASAARMQLASDPMAVCLLVDVVRRHLALAAHEGAEAQQQQQQQQEAEGEVEAGAHQQQALSKTLAAAWPAVRVLHAVALEPVGKVLLGDARGIHALVDVLCTAPPGSKVMAAAAAALHTAVRGSVANSTLLASMDLKAPLPPTPAVLATAGPEAAAAAAGSGAGGGHEAPLRAHLHRALACVMGGGSTGATGMRAPKGRRNSFSSNASVSSSASASSTSTSASGSSAAAGRAPAAPHWTESAAAAAAVGGVQAVEDALESACGGGAAAALSADLCALLCVMDRYRQHAVDAAPRF